MKLPRPIIMLDIVEEHFEDLDFLWEQREGVVFAPDWTLRELMELEERAEAHLDGLRLAQGHAEEIALARLAGEDRGAATAATLTLMGLESPSLADAVADVFAAATSISVRDGIRVGLRHSDIGKIVPALTRMASTAAPAGRAAAADVLAFHRQPPPRALVELLNSPDPEILRGIFAAVGRFGGPWSIDLMNFALNFEDPDLRRLTLQSAARLGVPNLFEICRNAATRPTKPIPEALTFLGVLADKRSFEAIETALGRTELTPAALAGFGCLGSIQAVPLLLEALKTPRLAPAAGAAFVRITGATNIAAEAPLPPPADLPEEERDFWDDTRPVDPDRASHWWSKANGRFVAEGRWQSGYDLSGNPMAENFNLIPLQSRRDVFLCERARNRAHVPDLELERRGKEQLR